MERSGIGAVPPTIFWMYIIQNPAGRFYVGHTDDLDQRIGFDTFFQGNDLFVRLRALLASNGGRSWVRFARAKERRARLLWTTIANGSKLAAT